MLFHREINEIGFGLENRKHEGINEVKNKSISKI